MFRLFHFAFLMLPLCGCTRTVIQTETWTLHRVSLLQRVTLPALAVATNGTVTLQGYTNDGGADAAAKITAAAVNAALTAAK